MFQEYQVEGITEEVINVETENPVYYLLHHPVIRENRTATTMRFVSDASSHERVAL